MSMNLGINVVEVDGATPSIQGAPTSVAGFVIRSERGVPGVVRQISNFTQFTDYFGGYVIDGNDKHGTPNGTQTSYVGAYAVRGFFDNGGSMAYVSRVVGTTATPAHASFAMVAADGSVTKLTVTAGFRGQPDPGEWGNKLAVSIVPNANVDNAFDLTVARVSARSETPDTILESWTKLVIGGASGAQDPSVINDPNTGSKYIHVATISAKSWASGSDPYAAGAYVTNKGNVYVTASGGPHTGDNSDGPTGKKEITVNGVTWNYVRPSITTTTWKAGEAYVVGNTVTSGTNLYQATTDGTSATYGPQGKEASIPDGIGDGKVTWAYVKPWAAGTPYGADALVTSHGNVYRVKVAGNSKPSTDGTGGPTATGTGDISDGPDTLIWRFVSDSSALWQASNPYLLDAVVKNVGNVYIVTTAGKSAATNAATNAGPTGKDSNIADGSTLKWDYVAPASTTLTNGTNDTLSEPALTTALTAQVTVPSPFDHYDISLLACPETTDPGFITAALTYCSDRGDCMFVGHVPDRCADVSQVKDWVKVKNLRRDKAYGALYFPYIQVVDPIGSVIWIPPVGHVMGVYARTDQQRGIWKAPAGNGAVVDNALDVRRRITDADHTDLVKNGSVNAIRPITGTGIVIDSSRTLSTNTLWLYVNVRLLFNYVKTSLKLGLRWVVQEPNNTALWNRIKYNSVTPFLLGLWRRGAFGPGASADVFTIKVDGENNTADSIQNGILNVEVYFYPSRPAETIVITVGQQEGGGKVTDR
jgi:phage tail sheath protein FI